MQESPLPSPFEIALLMASVPLLVLLHEAGHALFARWGGFRVTSFAIGVGRPLWHVRIGQVVVHVDRWFLAGGHCIAIPTEAASIRRMWFHGGGLIAQAVLGLFLMLLPDGTVVDRIEIFNGLVALTNAIPWRYRGNASDGWYLLDALTGGTRGGEVVAQRAALEKLAARESAVESPIGRLYADVCLAWIDVLCGRTAEAGYFFNVDPPESVVEPWVDALYHYVHAEWHRLEGRPLAALRTIRQTRSAYTGELDDQPAGMLAVAEARCLLDLDAPEQAQRSLARVAGLGGPIGRQAAAVHLAAVLDGEPGELEFATWRVVRQVREPLLDAPDVAMILWEAASQLDEHRKMRAADGARAAARQLAQRTLAVCEPEDRLPIMRRIGEAAGYAQRNAAEQG